MIRVGESASFSKTISEADVYGYAGIVGDFNSAHVNKVIAEKSIFKKRVVHGMLAAGLISTVLGTILPGPGTIYLEQDVKFLRPVFFEDTITARVTVEEAINPEKGIYRMKTTLTNQDSTVVADGFAVVKYQDGVA